MIQNEDNSENSVLPLLISPRSENRGKIEFCKNLIANLFKKGESPCTKEFPDVKKNFSVTISKVYVVSHHTLESTQ